MLMRFVERYEGEKVSGLEIAAAAVRIEIFAHR